MCLAASLSMHPKEGHHRKVVSSTCEWKNDVHPPLFPFSEMYDTLSVAKERVSNFALLLAAPYGSRGV